MIPPRDAEMETTPSGPLQAEGFQQESLVGDQSVNLFGRPVDKSKTGSWRAAPFIFGMDIGETISSLGITLNLVGHLVGTQHIAVIKSANIMTNFMGLNYICTVFWAFIADSFLGKFWTISISSFIHLVGLTLLTLRVSISGLKPEQNCMGFSNSTCEPASSRQLNPLYIALALVAVGSGGIKPNISVLGADQFDDSIEEEREAGTRFFNWFFFFIQIGSFTCVTFLVYVQDNAGFTWGYGILWGIFLVSFFGFVIGAPLYRHKIPSGSAIVRVAQVLVASFLKWKVPYPRKSTMLYEVQDQAESAIKGSRKMNHTAKFRFLDKAAIVTMEDQKRVKGAAGLRGPWQLCTVTQVEELKSILKMIPIWASSCVVYTLIAQLTSFSLIQASTMNRQFGDLEVPPASLPVFPLIVVLICVPLYDITFVPFIRQFTGHPRGISPLQRIGVGIFISMFAMISAALVEKERMVVVDKLHLNSQDITTVQDLPISVFWLVPQYTILGITEMFASVGQLEFFYSEAPDGLRGIAMSFYYTAISVGYFMSTIIVRTVNTVTKNKGRGSWLEEELNDGGIKKFYWLLAMLIFVDLFFYLVFAHCYVYKEQLHTQSDSSDLENMDKETGNAII